MIRIGFGGISHYNHIEEPPKPCSNQLLKPLYTEARLDLDLLVDGLVIFVKPDAGVRHII